MSNILYEVWHTWKTDLDTRFMSTVKRQHSRCLQTVFSSRTVLFLNCFWYSFLLVY